MGEALWLVTLCCNESQAIVVESHRLCPIEFDAIARALTRIFDNSSDFFGFDRREREVPQVVTRENEYPLFAVHVLLLRLCASGV